MSCLSPPPLDRNKPPNPLHILLIVVFVLLLIVGAASGASRAQVAPAPEVLGYWGLCNNENEKACFSAILRFKHGDRNFADCAVSMWSVGTTLSWLVPSEWDIRTSCLLDGKPEPAWWRAMRKDEVAL